MGATLRFLRALRHAAERAVEVYEKIIIMKRLQPVTVPAAKIVCATARDA